MESTTITCQMAIKWEYYGLVMDNYSKWIFILCIVNNILYCGFIMVWYGGFHSHGGYSNSWMVYFMENPIKMDDLGVYPHLWNPQYGIVWTMDVYGMGISRFDVGESSIWWYVAGWYITACEDIKSSNACFEKQDVEEAESSTILLSWFVGAYFQAKVSCTYPNPLAVAPAHSLWTMTEYKRIHIWDHALISHFTIILYYHTLSIFKP